MVAVVGVGVMTGITVDVDDGKERRVWDGPDRNAERLAIDGLRLVFQVTVLVPF